jgi:hypothetical protein
MCTCVCVRSGCVDRSSENNLQESVSCFHYESPRDWTQVVEQEGQGLSHWTILSTHRTESYMWKTIRDPLFINIRIFTFHGRQENLDSQQFELHLQKAPHPPANTHTPHTRQWMEGERSFQKGLTPCQDLRVGSQCESSRDRCAKRSRATVGHDCGNQS